MFKTHVTRLSHLFLVVVFFGACFNSKTKPPNRVYKPLYISFLNASQSARFEIELAKTPSKRSQGLMFRTQLDIDDGMLFAFPKEEKHSFWMKNTLISLDIIYLDKELRVVDIVEKTKPKLTKLIEPSSPAKYVLEINGGLAKTLNIQQGQTATFNSNLLESLHDL